MTHGERIMIQIKTSISSGIYASEGGGKTHVRLELPSSPRSLLEAANAIHEIREGSIRSFGNIGHGRTWLEVDGQKIEDFDLDDLSKSDRGSWASPTVSRTGKAASLINDVQSGDYAANRLAVDAAEEADYAASAQAGWEASIAEHGQRDD